MSQSKMLRRLHAEATAELATLEAKRAPHRAELDRLSAEKEALRVKIKAATALWRADIERIAELQNDIAAYVRGGALGGSVVSMPAEAGALTAEIKPKA